MRCYKNCTAFESRSAPLDAILKCWVPLKYVLLGILKKGSYIVINGFIKVFTKTS